VIHVKVVHHAMCRSACENEIKLTRPSLFLIAWARTRIYLR
jgi:hypothetical protein